MVYSVQEKMTERRRGLLNLERLPRPFELDHWMKNGKERESRHPWTSCSNLELTIVVFLKLVQWRMEKTSRRGARTRFNATIRPSPGTEWAKWAC